MNYNEPITLALRLPIVLARMQALGQSYRPMWIADDGSIRIAHTDDMIQYLTDLNVTTVLL